MPATRRRRLAEDLFLNIPHLAEPERRYIPGHAEIVAPRRREQMPSRVRDGHDVAAVQRLVWRQVRRDQWVTELRVHGEVRAGIDHVHA